MKLIAPSGHETATYWGRGEQNRPVIVITATGQVIAPIDCIWCGYKVKAARKYDIWCLRRGGYRPSQMIQKGG